MKFITENPKLLPARAGKARLHYVSPKEKELLPRRRGTEICIPMQEDAELHSLTDGTQFLFTMHIDQRYRGEWNTAAFFGGTDEEPFLVRLDHDILDHFKRGGEPGFFEALIPERIKKVGSAFRTEHVRQGDIFAVRTGFSWEALKALKVMTNGDHKDVEPKEVQKKSVYGTRHLFTGVGLEVNIPEYGAMEFVEGFLEAPDHEPRPLLDGVYVLGQTRYLFDPKNAD